MYNPDTNPNRKTNPKAKRNPRTDPNPTLILTAALQDKHVQQS